MHKLKCTDPWSSVAVLLFSLVIYRYLPWSGPLTWTQNPWCASAANSPRWTTEKYPAVKLQCAGGNTVHPLSTPHTGERQHHEGRAGTPLKCCSIPYSSLGWCTWRADAYVQRFACKDQCFPWVGGIIVFLTSLNSESSPKRKAAILEGSSHAMSPAGELSGCSRQSLGVVWLPTLPSRYNGLAWLRHFPLHPAHR